MTRTKRTRRTPISDNITVKLAELGRSAEWLAGEAELPWGTVSKIVSGTTRNPTLDSLQPIAKALGVTVEQLRAEAVR